MKDGPPGWISIISTFHLKPEGHPAQLKQEPLRDSMQDALLSLEIQHRQGLNSALSNLPPKQELAIFL